MNSQVTGRYQRARGLKLKRALQFATLLAICIWLLYRINHPQDQKLDYDKSSPSKFNEQYNVLGRKVNPGWLTRRNETDSEGGKFVDKSENLERGAGDDQLAKRREEKAKEYLEGKSVLANDKDDQRNFEMQRKDLRGGNDGDNMHKEAEIYGKKPEIDAEAYSKSIKGKDVIVVLNKTGEHHLHLELEDKDGVFPGRMDNPWQHATENGLPGSGFDDENGVPLGLNDVTETKGPE